jgi:integrase
MARAINRLNVKLVQSISAPGRHADGGGLYLNTTNGGRRWIFLFKWHGKQTEMGLGPARDVPLARARELAAKAREHLAAGVNPVVARAEARAADVTALDQAPATFGSCADELIANMSPSWRNAKHRQQWSSTLRDHAAELRTKPIAEIATADVLAVLQPLWTTKPETASRIRGRIERVLDFAKAKGLRAGENPARWRGHLDQVLPQRARLTRGHHAAMPYPAIGHFMARLRDREAVAARALELAILTAARSGEVLAAKWNEFDLDRAVWTVPVERMKAGREHRVPLSAPAVALLEASRTKSRGSFVFPSQRPRSVTDAPLSGMALQMILRRMGVTVTPHGFRSTFRDWAAEETSFPNHVCELALAHVIENRAEAAYRRGDLFEKRRALMDEWAAYCAQFPVTEDAA